MSHQPTVMINHKSSIIDLDNPIEYSAETVGLSTNRPFRFCTMHCNCSLTEPILIKPGDNPEAIGQECVEIFIPDARKNDHSPDSVNSVNHSMVISEEDLGYNYTPAHRHRFYEIALVRGGSADHYTREGIYKIQRGDVILATPTGVHGYERNGNFLYTDIYLQPEWFFDDLRLLWSEEGLVRFLLADALFRRPQASGVFQFRCNEKEIHSWERELRDMEQEAQKKKPSLAFYNGCFLKILSILNDAFLRSEKLSRFPYRSDVWAAASYIEEWVNQGNEFNLTLLAHKVGISAPYFSKLFRENTGWSPYDYYQNRRIQHSIAMMMDANFTITDIAHRLNFADGAHYSRTFKKFLGISPQKYRDKQNRLHDNPNQITAV